MRKRHTNFQRQCTLCPVLFLIHLYYLHMYDCMQHLSRKVIFCIENLYFWVEFSIVFFCMYYSKMVIGYCLLIRLVFTLTISVSRSQRLRDLTPFALVENVFCKLPTVVLCLFTTLQIGKKSRTKGKMQLQTKEWNSIPFWNTFGARFSSIIIIKMCSNLDFLMIVCMPNPMLCYGSEARLDFSLDSRKIIVQHSCIEKRTQSQNLCIVYSLGIEFYVNLVNKQGYPKFVFRLRKNC